MTLVAALNNPIADKTGKHPQEWYHGSPHDYEHFGDPASFSSTLFEDDPDDTKHWNTLLGNHFTSDHRVAEDFAGGEHSSEADIDETGPLKHVIHAKLHVKNPKVYKSEHDMDQEVYEHEWNRGNFHDKYNPPPEEGADEDELEEFREDSGARRHYIGDSEEKYSPHDPHPDYPYTFHPKATGWLNSHPDKDDIAANFKKRLQAQGYDGIVYGNEYEKSSHGRAADSAIAFEPEQIEITQHHYGDQKCLPPEEAKRRTPPPGQLMVPGTEHYKRKLPEERYPDTSKHWPTTWTPSFFENKKTSALQGEDTGRLSAPLPQECWDRYYGRRTAKTASHGPFFHGTASEFKPGDLVHPDYEVGGRGKGKNEVFMTLDPQAAHNYGKYKAQARWAIGDDDAAPHAYEVEPTGPVEPDDTVDERFQAWRSRHPLRVVREIERGRTSAKQPHGEQSALNEMGQQDVYAVRSGDSMVNLCAYHRDVHVGNSKAADALGDQLGLSGRERSAETLGGARKGSCAACGKDTAYQLKLLMPRSMQAERDSRQPRRRGRPYVPAGTKPLAPLKQSENSLIDYFDLSRTASEDHPAYTDWDEHYPTFHEIHRGIAVRLPQELHDRLHAEDDDLEDEGDSRGMVMHDLIGHLNTKPGGWHWTADPHVAERFSHDYAGMAHDDHDTPVTHLVISGEKPDRKDIETDPDRLDEDEHEGVSAFDEGSGEKEVPLKRGTKVHVNSISWKLHNGTQPSMGWRGYNVAQDDDLAGGPRHVTAVLRNPYNEKIQGASDHPEVDNPDEWYHGSGKHYMHFDDPAKRPDRRTSFGSTADHTHWNTWLGTHFTEREDVAASFSLGSGGADRRGNGYITHAKLHLKNPKIYGSEYDMDREVYGHEFDSGNHPYKHDSRFEHEWEGDPHLGHHEDLRKLPGGTEASRLSYMRWLSTHPDSKNIALRYKDRLKNQGYDGIVYGNEIERGEGQGSSTHKSAIAFRPDQIEITQHHVYDPDKGYKEQPDGTLSADDSENPHQCKVGEEARQMHRNYPHHDQLPLFEGKKLPTLRMLAHDATENQEIRHCPFCGGGKIIGRNDGSVECEFCHNYFTVQSQPQYPNFPQTINGVPQSVPGMPGQVESPNGGGVPGMPPGAPGDDEEGEEGNPFADDSEGAPEDAEEDEGGNEPPPFAKKSFRTVTGARLGEDDYVRHLAIRLAPDRDAMIARIRSERGTR